MLTDFFLSFPSIQLARVMPRRFRRAPPRRRRRRVYARSAVARARGGRSSGSRPNIAGPPAYRRSTSLPNLRAGALINPVARAPLVIGQPAQPGTPPVVAQMVMNAPPVVPSDPAILIGHSGPPSPARSEQPDWFPMRPLHSLSQVRAISPIAWSDNTRYYSATEDMSDDMVSVDLSSVGYASVDLIPADG